MREITQAEAEVLRDTLKEIASFYNPAVSFDGGQAAALGARETPEGMRLFLESDIEQN